MIVQLWQGTIQNTFQNIHHSSRLRNIRCSNLLANVKCIRRPEEAKDGGGSEPDFPSHPAEPGCGARWSPWSIPSALLFCWISLCSAKRPPEPYSSLVPPPCPLALEEQVFTMDLGRRKSCFEMALHALIPLPPIVMRDVKFLYPPSK